MRSLFLTILFLFTTAVQARDYVVKKGDTLASLARSYYGEPVFGPKGSINKIYKLNSWAKKTGIKLEPGQVVVLEDKEKPREEEAAAPIVAPVPEPPPAPVPIPVVAAPPPQPEHEEEKAPPPPPEVHHEAPPPHEPPHHEAHHAEAHPHEAHYEHTHNYFSIIPSYSMIQQKATETASGASFSLSSTTSYGAEFGWDHWWNDSFSTILTYNVSQVKSTSKSDLTGADVLPNMTLSEVELAFLNRVIHPIRMGFGVAYGDHLFLETFGDTPADPTIYKASFWNPFFTAEITALENESFEFLINLKVAALPAQVIQNHDLNRGTEFFAQISLLQKFESWALTYGLSYSTENQTRTDADETRTETALRIGVLF